MTRIGASRLPATLLAVIGALIATLVAQAAGSPLIALGLAALAGIGLSLMLYGVPLRLLGVLVTALAVAGAGWAVADGQWGILAGFIIVAAGTLGILWWGPRWRRRSPQAARRLDDWAAMDAGVDPTAEHEQRPPHGG